jgi:hypothetical protein
MARPSQEYQAFTSLVDRLLTVPKDEINRRHTVHKERSAANPRKRGPKPKVKPLSSTDHDKESGDD